MVKEKYDYTTAYREHGNGKYLGYGETFEGVVAEDEMILAKNGVSHEEIGKSLRTLLSTYNEFYARRDGRGQYPIEGVGIGCQVYDLGQEYSPYGNGLRSNIDWRIQIDGMQNGNKAYHPEDGPTFVSDMMPELIAQLGFFEGTVFYGIKPEWAITVHRIVQRNALVPYNPIYTPRAWDACRAYFGSIEGINPELAPAEIIKNAFHKEVLSGNLIAYVAPGNLDLHTTNWSGGYYSNRRNPADTRENEFWGLLIATESVRLSLDATLLGIPFGAGNLNDFRQGEIMVIRVFPFTDKLVG